MPDLETRNDDIQDRLANLGEQFNTNKEFGLMGFLEAKNETQAQPAAVAADPEPGDEGKPPEWFEPLNSSLRAISETNSRDFAQIRNELAATRQPVQQVQQESFDSQDPMERRVNQLGQELAQTKINTAWQNARNSFQAAKSKFGADFDYSEQDLVNTWREHIGNNQAKADATNWDVYFKQQYDSRRVPKLEQRLKELESQKPAGRDLNANLGALPRGNRNGAPQAAAVASGDFDEDVYRSASKQMSKGSFKGFNRLLVEAQNRKLLRTAV